MDFGSIYPAANGGGMPAPSAPAITAGASGSLSQAASGAAQVSGDGNLGIGLAALVLIALWLLSTGRGG